MEVFSLIWDFLFGTFFRIYHYITTWYENATAAGFIISRQTLIEYILLAILLCASMTAAMTIAELKFRNRWLHGFLGIICPVIYPVLMHFLITKAEKPKDKDTDGEQQHKIAEKAVPKSELKAFSKDGEPELPAPDVMNQEYFSKISKDESGNYRGPFILELNDGQILEIEHVLEALAQAVAVQIGKDDDARKIRLPYNKIVTCKTREQWLEKAEAMEDEDFEEEDFEEGETE